MDEAGEVHWPLVFVYPETMQMDAVEDAAEGDTLAAHLDAMFAPGAPPLAWDTADAYTRVRLELFYLSHATRPLSLEHLTEVTRTPAFLCQACVNTPFWGRGLQGSGLVKPCFTVRCHHRLHSQQ